MDIDGDENDDYIQHCGNGKINILDLINEDNEDFLTTMSITENRGFLDDIDNDNKFEFIVSESNTGYVYIFEFPYISSNLNISQQFKFVNERNTGCYDCDDEKEIIERPQSKIVNNEAFDVSGNLIMKLRLYGNPGEVVEEKIVVDQEITIPAQGLIKLDTGKDNLGHQVFAGWNNLNVNSIDFGSPFGEYDVYVKFTTNNQFIENIWKFLIG